MCPSSADDRYSQWREKELDMQEAMISVKKRAVGGGTGFRVFG